MNLGSIWSNTPIPERPARPIQQTVNKPVNNIKRHVNQASTRSYWGTSVWFFFHTISCRINANFYASNYKYVWDFIKDVCGALPCPFCQKHAVEYVSKISIQQINTKKKLQMILFNFHNSVNSRTKKQIAGIGVLSKYNRANIKQIFDLFEQRFFHSYIGRRHFDDWTKNDFRKKFIKFYNIVRTKFD